MDISITVPINKDGDELDIKVHVEYEIIRRQPDVGIMHDYAELIDISIPDEHKDNVYVKNYLYKQKTLNRLEDKVNDKLKD